MGYEAKGKLHTISETQQISERFSKREFVVEIADNPKYPQTVQFELTGDRCEQLDGLSVGDVVLVEFSLRGREWNGPKGVRYFNSLDVWKVVPENTAANKPKTASSREAVTGYGSGQSYEGGDGSDIPF